MVLFLARSQTSSASCSADQSRRSRPVHSCVGHKIEAKRLGRPTRDRQASVASARMYLVASQVAVPCPQATDIMGSFTLSPRTSRARDTARHEAELPREYCAPHGRCPTQASPASQLLWASTKVTHCFAVAFVVLESLACSSNAIRPMAPAEVVSAALDAGGDLGAVTNPDTNSDSEAGKGSSVDDMGSEVDFTQGDSDIIISDSSTEDQSDVVECADSSTEACVPTNACSVAACINYQCVTYLKDNCVLCINEHFDAAAEPKFAVLPSDSGGTSTLPFAWQVSTLEPWDGKGHLRASWQSAGEVGPAPTSSIVFPRIYAQPKGSVTLRFRARMVVADQTCGSDDLLVRANGKVVWEQCGSLTPQSGKLGAGYVTVVVELGDSVGAPLELEIMARTGSAKGSFGDIDLDAVELAGACSTACMGNAFEPSIGDGSVADASEILETIPQAWDLSSTDPGYLSFLGTTTDCHQGGGCLTAAWSAAPSGQSVASATLEIPQFKPLPTGKATLRFALKSTGFSTPACDANSMSVSLGGQVLFERCDPVPNWEVFSVDLPNSSATDLVMRVLHAASPGTAGAWTLDDLAVIGDCTWACFVDTFQGGTAGNWAVQATNGWAPWKESSTKYSSSPTSLFSGYSPSNAPKPNTSNKAVSKAAVHVPVTGAAWSASVWSDFNGAQCPAQVVAAISATGAAMPLVALCGPTAGWLSAKGEVPIELRGRSTNLALMTTRWTGNTNLETYVDDLTVTCR